MLKPTYTELMEILNRGEDNKITSRYTIVIAAAKRARQLLDGATALATAPSDKTVSIAISEMASGKVTITTNVQEQDEARPAEEPPKEE
jgi:DNA-directed RNA polymerase subunit omega